MQVGPCSSEPQLRDLGSFDLVTLLFQHRVSGVAMEGEGTTTLTVAGITFANIISLARVQSEGLNLTAKDTGGCSLPVCTGRRDGI